MLKKCIIALLLGLSAIIPDAYSQPEKTGAIDRKALVQRHRIKITNLREPGPSQVGNGNFAYGFDVTGMQTINSKFATMASWGWHSTPPPADPATYIMPEKLTGNRMVPYEIANPAQPELSKWLEANPHKFNLARVGLWRKNAADSAITEKDITAAVQYFDLWSGIAESTFKIDGHQVKVTTIGDPKKDVVAFRIESPLIAQGSLGIFIEFPYANLGFASNGSDYKSTNKHTTDEVFGKSSALFNRTLDSTKYQVALSWTGGGSLKKQGPHRYTLLPESGDAVAEYTCSFSPKKAGYNLPNFSAIKRGSQKYWPSFWQSGGAVDLSKSSDSRWFELERRIVLSQYLVKINCSGKYPPQETGLVGNSWYGRFHYEMIWWNQSHFALWNRWPLLQESLKVYENNLESSIKRAKMQGYKGARYPKCTGPDGREWPYPVHAYLIWQQPHPIFFADLDYRAHPTKAVLKKWSRVVENSADFLASFARLDSSKNTYNLAAPIAFVPENNDQYKDQNPAFELAYWRYGLKTAMKLRTQLGRAEKPEWKRVYDHLAPLPVKNGVYEQWENIENMWTKYNYEHPALLGVFGMLPGYGVDTLVMNRTYEKVRSTWKFDACWGWDFPMAAMTAARIGKPADAIDMLLFKSNQNTFDAHGMASEGKTHYPYMPANGGLLYTVAMMCAGWDGAATSGSPGFPSDGSWNVRWENLSKAP